MAWPWHMDIFYYIKQFKTIMWPLPSILKFVTYPQHIIWKWSATGEIELLLLHRQFLFKTWFDLSPECVALKLVVFFVCVTLHLIWTSTNQPRTIQLTNINTKGLVTFRPSYVFGRPFSAHLFRPSFDIKSVPKSAKLGVIKRC